MQNNEELDLAYKVYKQQAIVNYQAELARAREGLKNIDWNKYRNTDEEEGEDE